MSRYNVLQTIYELVKEDAQPTMLAFTPSAVILRLDLPWDLIVNYLNGLHAEGLVRMQQLNTASISITSAGLVHAAGLATGKAA